MIKDSGNRTEFTTGAVRDIQEGKGRCDLLPLDIVANYVMDDGRVIDFISNFTRTGMVISLQMALWQFLQERGWDNYTMFLEVSKHFEEGCNKYGENNWQKGIPAKNYVNSMVRHYFKWARGDDDEPHDRAFCWNVLCCIWTCRHKPELNDYEGASVSYKNERDIEHLESEVYKIDG